MAAGTDADVQALKTIAGGEGTAGTNASVPPTARCGDRPRRRPFRPLRIPGPAPHPPSATPTAMVQPSRTGMP